MENKIVITGAPGTGKTTIINQLKSLGYSCSNEISREIIAEQIATGGDILPWKDLTVFSNSVFSLRKAQYINASTESLHFFDRSMIDVIAYLKADNLKVSNQFFEDCKKFRYNNTVFYTPIWEKIYHKDLQRQESLSSAKKIEKFILTTYKSFGYSLVEIPKQSTKQRVDFILS